ncbi:DUF4861 family protein [Mariniflexile litorale]|uniref:DUF4861 family protein n=1 Tax=Mariniflexile litorale TaxID=3045158 RepID=A0AAU7ECD7_9FLAO|nr:DUF4861 family protein [Mariniflexile sp. KMM 9835]MDQ8213461.1 DUF4861 family protein [Mariniflexile sp. KMM 9835]
MKKFSKVVLILNSIVVLSFFSSCKNKKEIRELTLVVVNNLDFARNEVVAIKSADISEVLKHSRQESIRIQNQTTKEYITTQWIDNDQDGVMDELLFQSEAPANASVKYVLVIDSLINAKETTAVTFSRLVPERTDDYTWENDKVAFRTYGPEAQRRIEQNEYGGTLSSGIDLWLKRVNYSIIDKWYAKNIETEGYYHIDHGEGYDPYHVGKSRGTGGIGIWENDSLYVSKNFIAYKTIARGPLRTVFELDYAPWSNYKIKETKRVTLDLGSNFSKFEIKLNSEEEAPNYTIGITKHDGKGEVKLNNQEGWFRHWEPIDDAFIGEGIVIDNSLVKESINHDSKTPDQSQVLIVTQPKENTLSYYVGFAWTKSGQVFNVEDWDKMLDKQSMIVKSPLVLSIVKTSK